MPSTALSAAVAALDSHRPDDAAKEELRRSVAEFISLAHKSDWSPERMLIEVKRLLAACGHRKQTLMFDKDRPTSDELADEVVRLCIEQYYAQSERIDS